MSTPTVTTTTTTLHFRRNHPGGGVLGRCSYGIAGVPGIVVFDVGMFAGGVPPATIELPFAMAVPSPRVAVAKVTSAVVAAGVAAVAQSTGTAIATPVEVAQAAPAVAATILTTVAQAATAPRLRRRASK